MFFESERGRLVRIERDSARQTVANQVVLATALNVALLRWRTSRARSDLVIFIVRFIF